MSDKPPLTRAILDHVRCGIPDCTSEHEGEPIYLHGRCHMGAGNEVEYLDGVLSIRCVRCKKEVGRIKVAES